MREWIDGLHWSWAVLFFWAGAIVRTCTIYALGYFASHGGKRFRKIKTLRQTPLYLRAEALVNRWGVLAVPACFFTVGLQTAVIITTGFTRMSLVRWIPAMLIGTLWWGIIYGTVGMAVIWAWLENPKIAGLVLIVSIGTIFTVHRFHRAKASTEKEGRARE